MEPGEEREAVEQLQTARSNTGSRAAAAWVHIGEFIADNELDMWSGLTAKACFRTALDLLTPGVHDPFRADALLGYGAALTEEGSGYRDPVLEEAITCLSVAIPLFARIPDREAELEARYFRAYANTELVGTSRYAAGEVAIEELEDLRGLVDRRVNPVLFANIHSLLGNAYLDRAEGDRRENHTQAESAFRGALKVHQRMGSTSGCAQGNLDLAVTFNRLRTLGDLQASHNAIYYARKAAKFVDADIHLELKTTILVTYAKALQDRGGRQWVSNCTKAEALLENGIKLARTAGNLPVEQVLRLARAQLVLDLCQYANRDRTVDVEADLEASQSGLDPTETLIWWLQWQELSGLLGAVAGDTQRMIDAAETSLKHVTTVLEQAESFAEKAEYLSRLSFIADLGILGYLNEAGPPAGLRFARRVFARLIGSDTSVFETPEGAAELYLLNPVTPDWCGVLVSAGEYCTFYELEGVGKDFWNEAIDELRPGFFSGMAALRRSGGMGHFAELLEEWVLAASGALGPVLTDIQDAGYKEIVVFAFGGWCTVPVSALQLPGSLGSALIEQAAIAHGPDQFVAHEPRLDRILHVADARLDEANTETQMLCSLTDDVVTCANLNEVQNALSEGQAFDCIHFTTHGEHDFDHLEGAGIRCADDELLTARWVFEHAKLKGGPLVCLAACQTGLTDFANLPHETFGLPMAFLAAGASAVISTQWPVDDVATRLLMTRFYQELQSGCTTAESLQRAQLWLRGADEASLAASSSGATRFSSFDANWQNPDLPPFSHVYFWAGYLLHRA